MSEFLEVISPSALKELQAVNAEIVKTIAGVKEVNANMISIKTPSGSDSAIKKLTADYQKQEKQIESLQKKLEIASRKQQADLEKTRLAEIRLQQQREKSFDNYEKQLQKEEASLRKAEGTYQRYQNSVNELIKTYRDLAIRKELGGNLTVKEEAQLLSLTNRLNMYQNALKKVDAQIGNHQREVGNYAKANGNLSNSIGQITRELPNFGQSFSIGVLSLTNNVGALIDSIKQVKEQNLELQSQGKQTKSVFSQLLSSVFSWQTALFIGIGIFSAYSKEIGEFVSSLFSANSALKANERAFVDAYDARMRYNGATADSTKKTQKEFEEFVLLVKGMRDVTKSQEERLNMAKRFKDAYPGYLKVFSEEQIIAYSSGKANKELSKTIEQLTKDIKERNLAIAESEETSKTFSLMADLKQEFQFREAQNKLINTSSKNIREFVKKRAEDRVELLNDSEDFINKFGKANLDELGNYSVSEIQTLKTRYNALVKEFNAQRAAVSTKLLNTSLLDFKEDKKTSSQREKIALDYSEIESQYKLRQAILERQKAELADMMNNEKNTLDLKIKYREEYSKKSIELLDLQLQKESAILADKASDDFAKNELALKNKDIKQERFNSNRIAIANRLNNELLALEQGFDQNMNQLRTDDLAYYKKIEDEKRQYTEKTQSLILNSAKEKFKKVSDDEKNTLKTRQSAFEEYLRIARKELDIAKIREISNAKSQEEIDLIIQKYAELNRQLNEIQTPLLKAQKTTEDWIKSLASGQIESSLNAIGMSSLKMFLDFDSHGQTTFDKLLEGADTVAERFAITFQAVGDVAQGVFNAMTEMSNQHFENQRNNLEQDYQIALAFAGDSVSAREEVERQYEARQRAIRRREFQAKKQMALFNIAIDTAQGIVSALAMSPPNVPLSIAIGVIGAIQAGTVLAQQVPQFWTGTDNAPEGWALTQEKGREIITDKNGNIKSKGSDKGAQLTYLNKGDKVLNNEKTMDYLMFNNDLNSILTNNSIGQPIVEVNNKGISDSQVNKIVNAIENKAEFSQLITNGDLKTVVRKGNTETEIMNRRVKFERHNQ